MKTMMNFRLHYTRKFSSGSTLVVCQQLLPDKAILAPKLIIEGPSTMITDVANPLYYSAVPLTYTNNPNVLAHCEKVDCWLETTSKVYAAVANGIDHYQISLENLKYLTVIDIYSIRAKYF